MAGEHFQYTFDAMGRPNTMTSNSGATNWISGVTYTAAGLPKDIYAGNGSVAGETREYNVLGQLTKIVSGNYDFRYNFSASANDGRITSQSAYQGGVLQETINYSYDSLNRLTGASSSAGPAWSATYQYDGFTNLLGTTSTGFGPGNLSITVDAATNRVNGWFYDNNGNTTGKPGLSADYDVENRLRWASGPGGEEYYGYGADNRRVYQSKLLNPGTGATQEIVTFWSAGKRAARYELNWSGSSFVFRTLETNVWFGGKPLKLGSETNVVVDRLGSVRRSAKDYFPYGQENPSTTAGEKEKYATYYHDGRTDLAYADQRYYATGAGRFMTADPAGDGLNWYGYSGGDPVNGSDPRGLAATNCAEIVTEVLAKGGAVSGCADKYVLGQPSLGGCNVAGSVVNGSMTFLQIWCTTLSGGNNETESVTFFGIPNDGQIADAMENLRAKIDAAEQALFLGVLETSRQRLVDTMTDKCASAIGAPELNQATSLLGYVPISLVNPGPLQGTTDAAGVLVSLQPMQFLARAPLGPLASGGYIEFNRTVNWASLNSTLFLNQSGFVSQYHVSNGFAAEVGAPALTNSQLVDLIMLHELSHIFGVDHGGGQAAFDTNIWRNCLQ